MASEYSAWWGSMMKQDNRFNCILKWFNEHSNELPKCCRSIISIGPGCGELDLKLLNGPLGGVEYYTAVEPDGDLRKMTEDKISGAISGIQVQSVSEDLESWGGPEEPVDVILVFQVFYYISDPVAELRRLHSWLKPGGCMIIGHNYDSLYAGIATEAGLKEMYWMDQLVKDSKTSGLEHINEYKLPCVTDLDYGPLLDEEPVKAYLTIHVEGTNKEDNMNRCLEIFRKRYENKTAYQKYSYGILLVQKMMIA